MERDSNYLDYFLEMMIAERNVSINTIDSYKKDLNDLYSYSKIINKNIINLTHQNLNNLISKLKDKNLSPNSITRKISTYRQFFSFLLSEKFISKNPAANIKSPKKASVLPKALSISSIDKLLLYAKNDKSKEGIRNYAMIEILYSTGMRVSELIKLDLSIYNKAFTEENMRFTIIKGKGDKERMIILNKNATEALFEYIKHRKNFVKNGQETKWLFPSISKNGKMTHITRQRFGQILKHLSIKAGLNQKISPHKIRHSFATHMLENGANLRVLQELLGHSDISSTQIYTKISNKKLKNFLIESHPLSK